MKRRVAIKAIHTIRLERHSCIAMYFAVLLCFSFCLASFAANDICPYSKISTTEPNTSPWRWTPKKVSPLLKRIKEEVGSDGWQDFLQTELTQGVKEFNPEEFKEFAVRFIGSKKSRIQDLELLNELSMDVFLTYERVQLIRMAAKNRFRNQPDGEAQVDAAFKKSWGMAHWRIESNGPRVKILTDNARKALSQYNNTRDLDLWGITPDKATTDTPKILSHLKNGEDYTTFMEHVLEHVVHHEAVRYFNVGSEQFDLSPTQVVRIHMAALDHSRAKLSNSSRWVNRDDWLREIMVERKWGSAGLQGSQMYSREATPSVGNSANPVFIQAARDSDPHALLEHVARTLGVKSVSDIRPALDELAPVLEAIRKLSRQNP